MTYKLRNITVRGNLQVIVFEDIILVFEDSTSMQYRSQEYVKCIAISLYIYTTFPSLSIGENLLYFTFILVFQAGHSCN